VDPLRALETLDYVEMLALAEMYERWALTEENVSGEQRTKLIQWSSDYEQIAEFIGPGWRASNPESPPGLIAFLAKQEASARGLYKVHETSSR
jgi:hypothetical protein